MAMFYIGKNRHEKDFKKILNTLRCVLWGMKMVVNMLLAGVRENTEIVLNANEYFSQELIN